ncbi:hypothetical protein BH18ACT13_BH18ACT13_06170 [soil metagenome]
MIPGYVVRPINVLYETDQPLQRIVVRRGDAPQIPTQRLSNMRGLGLTRARREALERAFTGLVEIDLFAPHTAEYTSLKL